MEDCSLTPLGHFVGVRQRLLCVAPLWGQTLQPVARCLLINTTLYLHCRRGAGPITTSKNGRAAAWASMSRHLHYMYQSSTWFSEIKLLLYCQTWWTAQPGSRWLLPRPIISSFFISPTWCHLCFGLYKTLKKLHRNAECSLRKSQTYAPEAILLPRFLSESSL